MAREAPLLYLQKKISFRMKPDFLFIIPMYNDWESVQQLQIAVEQSFPVHRKLLFLIVNDSSENEINEKKYIVLRSKTMILELTRNMGHQKAIAAGLSFANDHLQGKQIIVMDSDGEDRPEDIHKLIKQANTFNGIAFAQRAKRNEGLLFSFFYRIYKLLFILLTGKSISFGNFCLIPQQYLRKIVNVSDIWNHFSGGVIRSGIPYSVVATVRGKRYHGESKMNFTRLILHGLSAVSVYADFMAIRLILLSFFLIVVTAIGIGAVAFVRLFTNLAIPGWATSTVLGLGIILFLAFLLGLFLLFNVLIMKTQKTIIPAKDYRDYVFDVKTIDPHELVYLK
jgi:hypothetical protein